MTKQEQVWKLNEELGEEGAKAVQQQADIEKAEHYEQWFKSDILGRKSRYEEDE